MGMSNRKTPEPTEPKTNTATELDANAPSAPQLTGGVDVNTPKTLQSVKPPSTIDRTKLTNEEVHLRFVEAIADYQTATIDVFLATVNKLQLSLADLAAWATEITD